jgi:hypothetical protein
MGVFDQHARLRAIIVGGALSAALALPIGVSADTTGGSSIQPAASNGATIAVDAVVHVMSRVVATVDISFTCDPIPVYDQESGTTTTSTSGRIEYGSAVIVQATGRSINSGSAEFSGGEVLCDGVAVYTRSIPIVASALPWKSGAAAAGGTVYITDATYQGSDYASSGPIAVKLSK